uniref:Uncharacterized protein n=1 Tax=Pseudictyota dubia TaxID=2749911 RepID=A0A7R9VT47_9STRA
MVCHYLADGNDPSTLSVVPRVARPFRTLLDDQAFELVWRTMAETRWSPALGMAMLANDGEAAKGATTPPRLRVRNWKRFYRLRHLHLRDVYRPDSPLRTYHDRYKYTETVEETRIPLNALAIENCSLGLRAESSSARTDAADGNSSDDNNFADPDGRVWRLECPVGPSKLRPTSDIMVDHCTECKNDVYWVVDEFELRRRVSKGDCVYYDPGGHTGRKAGKWQRGRGRGNVGRRSYYFENLPPTPQPAPEEPTTLKPLLWYSDGSLTPYRKVDRGGPCVEATDANMTPVRDVATEAANHEGAVDGKASASSVKRRDSSCVIA